MESVLPRKLARADYAHPDPVVLARRFLGHALCVRTPEGYTEGLITETEAYGGREDRACHGYGGRRTARTEIMFGEGGFAYVYLCYGLHRLFNIVTGLQGEPMAVLIRAVRITAGVELVRKRREGIAERDWSSGPGRVSTALGIHMEHNKIDLSAETIWLEDRSIRVSDNEVCKTPRIGIAYAGEWVEKPWRFVWAMG